MFIVRIWHALSGGFRASVRRVDDDHTHHFDRPDAVTRFLSDECPGSSGADRGASPAGDGGKR
ncbi:MAG: hypothetical protein U5L03_10450 [Burkholderiaceae bacterium]|nr:hypothetical protein [Burkholderiaceae bacterium]